MKPGMKNDENSNEGKLTQTQSPGLPTYKPACHAFKVIYIPVLSLFLKLLSLARPTPFSRVRLGSASFFHAFS
jgi:hypothetical protein